MQDADVMRLSEMLRKAGHSNPAAVIRTLGKLFGAFERDGGAPPNKLAVYVEHLADIEAKTLEHVCAALICESNFLPTIAEIRRRVAELALDAQGVSESPERAWDEVIRKIGLCGTNRIPGKDNEHGPAVLFDDPVTAAIMSAEWWKRIGQSTVDSLPSDRRVFIDAYKAHAARIKRDVQTGRVAIQGAVRPSLPAGKEKHADRA